MIDLHIHTNYSDGTDIIEELLSKAQNNNLSIISITDHNSCSAYFDLESKEIRNIYKGKIIVGCEFSTSFNNRLIEILGYGLDYKKVNDYMSSFYTDDFNKKTSFKIYNRFIKKIVDLGLICDFENIELNSYFLEKVYFR